MERRLASISVIITAILLLSALLVSGQGQKIAKCRGSDRPAHAPKYRIGSVRRGSVAGIPLLLLQISVGPEYFNKRDMSALAQLLREDFCKEKHLNVAISDNYHAAKEGLLIHDLMVGEPNAALRGFYDLNRTTGEEGISFSTDGKPSNEVTINFNSK